jgi:excisionase family DNA binding protein
MNSETGAAEQKWLSIAEVAIETGVSEMTLYRLIAAGQLPAVQFGRRLVVPAGVLDALAQKALKTGRLVDASEWAEVEA